MSYTLENWQDNVTPITASNLLLYNSAIDDIDNRINDKQSGMTIAAVQTGNYTAAVNQIIPVSTANSSVTVSFPEAPPDGTRIGVKQVARTPPNVVTLQLSGSDTFNTTSGPTTVTLYGLNQGAEFQYSASSGVWINTADDVPLANTTARAIAMSMVLGSFAP